MNFNRPKLGAITLIALVFTNFYTYQLVWDFVHQLVDKTTSPLGVRVSCDWHSVVSGALWCLKTDNLPETKRSPMESSGWKLEDEFSFGQPIFGFRLYTLLYEHKLHPDICLHLTRWIKALSHSTQCFTQNEPRNHLQNVPNISGDSLSKPCLKLNLRIYYHADIQPLSIFLLQT